jgi:hypothetical protein
MHVFAAAGAAFLIAVLWFDLMFDVQIRGHGEGAAPPEVLASIGAYYRRVTTTTRPMGSLVSAVMLATVAAIVAELVRRDIAPWAAWSSLVLALSAIGLALARTVRSAVRLGAGQDTPAVATRLARRVWRDHLYCLAAMSLTLCLQLAASR